ncbi:hypothetical protein MP477_04285 [Chryseobacterium sp. WG23]|uniref:DUF6520 family protein n=1 Tax=Chryseobacterium sp. WG23 TaxID=2926910 RepID=UPI00211EB8BF|nr:DUF6520 family protein [Chryseobacterium sp. WG23]MCQ9634171.1 hypothetical protein [Chryseobacterium sp. WG23]
MRKILIPVAVLLMGAGAAYAGKADKAAKAIVDGYVFDNSQNLCVNTHEDCSTVASDEACTWSENTSITLRQQPSSGTMCGNPLFKVPQN